MVVLLLQPSAMRTALQLHREPPCCSGRGTPLGLSTARLGGRAMWAFQKHAARRLSAARAEFSQDPRGGGGGAGVPGSAGGPATQQQTYQQPWERDSYAYPPQTSTPPPRLPPNGNNGGGPGGGGGGGGASNLTRAFIAGAFILGMGAGIWFDSEVTFEPQNLASTQLVDTKTPNSEICMANGYSSMVFDQRIFVSFNPFNVYVSQPEVKPGCVLRRANFNVLERRGLVDSQQVQACKRNMNTFAFVGDLEGSPEVSCVYHSEEAENQFLKDPSRAAMGDGFQPRVNKPPADAGQ
ncbi:hypothetical protein ABPG77_006465 [Micractinium sp. CCAP 211/92]